MIKTYCDRCFQEMKARKLVIGTKEFDICQACGDELVRYREAFFSSFMPKAGGFLWWKKKQLVAPQMMRESQMKESSSQQKEKKKTLVI